jgi:predicted nucleic acid-binding protein
VRTSVGASDSSEDSAITDTGPPLHLSEISRQQVLGLYSALYVSDQVRAELRRHRALDSLEDLVGHLLVAETVLEEELARERSEPDGDRLQEADLSVLVLARRWPAARVLTDDLSLRRAAKRRGRQVTGSVGLLPAAYQRRLLDREQFVEAVNRLCDGSTLYLSKSFRAEVRTMLDDLCGVEEGDT